LLNILYPIFTNSVELSSKFSLSINLLKSIHVSIHFEVFKSSSKYFIKIKNISVLNIYPLGYLALDEKGNVSHYRKLSLEEAIEEGTKLEQGEFTESLKSFVNKLDKKSELKIIDDKIFDTLAKNGYKVKLLEDVKIINLIQKKAKEFLIKEEKLNEEEYYNLIRNFSIEITKIRIKGEQQRRDRIVIQVIESIDELNKTINILVERLVEWYGLYFPELYNILKDNERFTDLIINEPNRFNLNEEILIKLGFSEKISKRIVEAAIKTAGADFDEKDLEIIRSFATKNKTSI